MPFVDFFGGHKGSVGRLTPFSSTPQHISFGITEVQV